MNHFSVVCFSVLTDEILWEREDNHLLSVQMNVMSYILVDLFWCPVERIEKVKVSSKSAISLFHMIPTGVYTPQTNNMNIQTNICSVSNGRSNEQNPFRMLLE